MWHSWYWVTVSLLWLVSIHMEMIKIESEIEIYARHSDCCSQSKYRYVRGIYVSIFKVHEFIYKLKFCL